MVQILDAPERKKTFAQKLNLGIGRGLEMAEGIMQTREKEKKEKKIQQDVANYWKQLGGQGDISDLPIEMQKVALDRQFQAQMEAAKQKSKYESQLNLLRESGLSDIFGQGEDTGGFQQEQLNNSREIPSQRLGSAEIQEMDGKVGKQGGFQEPPERARQQKMFPADKVAKMALVNPAIADKMQKHNDNVLARHRHEETLGLRRELAEAERSRKEKEQMPETIREKQLTTAQASSDIKYNQELQSAHKQHDIKTQALNRLEELNRKGVTGKPYEKLLEKFGLISQTSEGRREFAADVKNLITDIKSILGGQFSQFEFQTILNAYPSADFSQKANESIIKNLKDFQDIRNQEFIIAKNIKKENGGKIPSDFQAKVNDRLQDYAQSKIAKIKDNTQNIMREQLGVAPGHTILIAPDGEPLAVPNEDIDRMIQLGAEIP